MQLETRQAPGLTPPRGHPETPSDDQSVLLWPDNFLCYGHTGHGSKASSAASLGALWSIVLRPTGKCDLHLI